MKKLYFLLITILTTSLSFGQIVINEIDADTPGTDVGEFIELLWTPNTALDGLVVVLYNGSADTSYQAFDLDGYSTDANGFFILANTPLVVSGDFDMGASNVLQNGADAVAIYTGNDTDFPSATAVTATNLIDALVYDTNDGDDTGLLTGLAESTQYNESENGANSTESIQRKADGTYETKIPTFRQDNAAAVCNLSLTGNSVLCDAFTTGTDTYTASVTFTGGGTSTYNVTSTSGTVGGDDPTTMDTGTITITGISEGTDITVNVENGGLCNLDSMVTSPVCEPSLALPIYENFDYTVGTNLVDASNWENINSGDEIIVSTGSLLYTDLAASTGESVNFEGSGIDSQIVFTPTTGTIYASFIFKVTDLSNMTDLTDGGYFAVLGNFDGRLWVRPDTDPVGTTYDIAYTNASSGSGFTTTKYNVNDDVFVVINYDTTSGVLNAWINPDSASFGTTEPAVTITNTDATTAASIDKFILRQDSTGETPAIIFDELRIGTTWAEVTPSATASIEKETIDGFALYPNPVSNGEFSIKTLSNADKQVQIFDMLGKMVYSNEVKANKNVQVSNLNTGIYILKVLEEGKTATRKLVIK